jgi:hypothetical protein
MSIPRLIIPVIRDMESGAQYRAETLSTREPAKYDTKNTQQQLSVSQTNKTLTSTSKCSSVHHHKNNKHEIIIPQNCGNSIHCPQAVSATWLQNCV